nr:unnamed protein product [Digitaria exilis]
MANPSYYQTSAPVRSQVQHQEHLFHLYAHQQMGNNEYNIVPAVSGVPNVLGQSNICDWDIRDVPDTKGTVVARLQGIGISSRKSYQSWHNTFNVVFTDQRFKGSTLSVQGLIGPATLGDEGDLAVVGGTGEFVYAQGCTNVIDWDIRDVPDTRANVVARLQGVLMSAGKSGKEMWYSSAYLVFTDQRFNGSTLSVQGPLGPPNLGDKGDWAVVGGTGEFVYAQGICSYKRIQGTSGGGLINELLIRVVCITCPKPVQVQKIGPWGGNGGNAYEIQDGELPQRLESLSIYAENFIQSIAFSYTDQTGQKRTIGPWGGDDGKSEYPVSRL